MSKRRVKQTLINIAISLIVLIVFFPIVMMLPSMFKDKIEIFAYPWRFFPNNPTADNFSRLAFLQHTSIGVNFFTSFLVTLGVAALAVIGSLAINMIAAFAFARLKFPLKKTLWFIVISTMFIPGITILITSIKVVDSLGMMDTLAVLVIPGLVSAYNIFFFRQFYLGFPSEIDEAARIDGANTFQIFKTIYFPMSKTPMVIVGAGTFMGYFNSYVWPMLTISQDKKGLFQVMHVVRQLFSEASTLGYGSVLAASFITLIPAIVVFAFLQKSIKDGIALSGMK